MRLIDTYKWYEDDKEGYCEPSKMDYDSEGDSEILNLWLTNEKVLQVIYDGYGRDVTVLVSLDKKEPKQLNLKIPANPISSFDFLVEIYQEYLAEEKERIDSILENICTSWFKRW